MKRYVFLLFLFLLGCAFNSKTNFEKNDNKVQIMIGASHDVHAKNIEDVNSYINFKNEKGDLLHICLKNGETKIFYIEPGHYELDSYRVHGSRQIGFDRYGGYHYEETIFPVLDNSNINSSFDVKNGDKVYLGHIITNDMKVKKKNEKKIFIVDFFTKNENLINKIDKEKFLEENKISPDDFEVKLIKWEKIEEKSKKQKLSDFILKKKSFVLLGASYDGFVEPRVTWSYPMVRFVYKNEKGNIFEASLKNNETNMFIINPGHYELIGCNIYSHDNMNNKKEKIFCSFNDDYVNKKVHAKFLESSFDIKQGEKIYLGNIYISSVNFIHNGIKVKNTYKFNDFNIENKNLIETFQKDKFYETEGIELEDFKIKLLEYKKIEDRRQKTSFVLNNKKAFILIGVNNLSSLKYLVFENNMKKFKIDVSENKINLYALNPGSYRLIETNPTIYKKYINAKFDIKEGEKLYLGDIYLYNKGSSILRNAKGINVKLIGFETENNNSFEDVKIKNKIYDSLGKEIELENFKVNLMNWERSDV